MKAMNPAVHHNPTKKATARFWHCGEYKKLTIAAEDRTAVIAYVKSMYPGVSKISVVFFVSTEGAKNE